MYRIKTYWQQKIAPKLKRYGLQATVITAIAIAVVTALFGATTVSIVFAGVAVAAAAGIGAEYLRREIRRRQNLSVKWLLRFLRKRGFYPEVDRDGDLLIRIEGMKYVLHLDEHYFELHIGFGRKRSELNHELLIRTAQEVMNSTRMVKILIREDAILFSIECLQRRKSEFHDLFDSYIRILKYAVSEHTRRYNDAIEHLQQEVRRKHEEEELTRRFANYQGKDVVN